MTGKGWEKKKSLNWSKQESRSLALQYSILEHDSIQQNLKWKMFIQIVLIIQNASREMPHENI